MSAPFGYRLLQGLASLWLRRITEIRVDGVEHVPASGPFVLIPNHQSAIDPLIVQSVCPRVVHTMTKSTQFASPVFRFLLGVARAFPARRFRVDPQCVRIVLRRLEEGEGVCLYPEGERSWDGTLQPFRRGAIRLLLRSGVPIVPVGIDGTYDVWPRWAGRPRRGHVVHLRFGAPIELGTHRSRAEREVAFPEAERLLRSRLLDLSGETVRRGAVGAGGEPAPKLGTFSGTEVSTRGPGRRDGER